MSNNHNNNKHDRSPGDPENYQEHQAGEMANGRLSQIKNSKQSEDNVQNQYRSPEEEEKNPD